MRQLAPVVVAAAAALAACSSPTPSGSCITNADCAGADTCNQGHCQPPILSRGASSASSTGGASTNTGQGNGSTGGVGSTGSRSQGGSTTGAGGNSTGGAGTTTTPAGSTSGGGSTTSGGSSSSGGSSGSACATACNAPFTCDAASGLCKNQGVPQLTNFWIIVMENTSFSSLTATAAPYLNSLFTGTTPGGVELVRYQDTGVHPSTPNYLGLVGGDNFGISGADYEASQAAGQVAATNQDIATQLEAAGLTWHEYSESQTSACQTSDSGSDSSTTGYFASKHDPMPHFLITQGTASCTANDVSYEPEGSMPGMAADIAAGTFYNYVFISPNMCDDGHDSCSPLNNQITQQDDWLSTNVPLILNSSAFKNNGFLFITWDEGASDSDAIMAVALSPMVANPGGQDNNNYTHYSLLSTVEAGFGLSSLPQLHGHNDPLITTIWK